MSSILPFSRQALLYLLSSDFLNPCPYELRHVKDEGSIKKTLEAAYPLLNTTGDDFISGRIERPVRPLYDKILRGIALAISALAIQIFLPPLSAFLHLTKVITLIALEKLSYVFTTSECKCSSLEITQHLDAAWYELSLIVTHLFIVPLVIMPITVNLSARDMASGLSFPEDTGNRNLGIYKALSLREDLGIVSENGNFCTWDPEEDDELNNEGQFSNLFNSVFDDLLDLIASFNGKLPLDSEFRIPYHYPPSEITIINHLFSTGTVNISYSDNEFYNLFNEKLVNILQRREYFSHFYLNRFCYEEVGMKDYFDMHLREESEETDSSSTDSDDEPSHTSLDYSDSEGEVNFLNYLRDNMKVENISSPASAA